MKDVLIRKINRNIDRNINDDNVVFCKDFNMCIMIIVDQF